MFTFEEKRDEARKALAELRRRYTNRLYTKRALGRTERRMLIMAEVVEDYNRAIRREEVRVAAQEPAGGVLQSEGAQYLMNLNQPRRLVPAGRNDGDQGSD